MAQAVYVTKYTAGGSGDNYIPDGYIKATEKIWVDNYTIAFTNTNTTIDIAVLPPNKKIIGIDVILYSTLTQTNGTVSIGFSTDANIDSFMAATTITHNLTRSGISLPTLGAVLVGASATVTSATIVTQAVSVLAGIQKITGGTQTTISVKLNNWTMTSGNLYTIVRYT